MLNSYEYLNLVPELCHFNESLINNHAGQVIGYSTVAIDKNGFAIGGGIHSSKDISRRIALSESLERSIFYQISEDLNLKQEFIIDQYPTTCGFAAGFEDEKTKLRAVCEAIERWAWSKWIDEKFYLEKIKRPMNLSSIASNFSLLFDDVHFYQRKIEIYFENRPLKLVWGVFIGLKDCGIFPGSRICGQEEDPWEHASIEAWRHLHMYQTSKSAPYKKDFYLDRVLYFAQNKDCALGAIPICGSKNWPTPHLRLCKKVNGLSFSLWRALCFDFIGWDQGNYNRFVY